MTRPIRHYPENMRPEEALRDLCEARVQKVEVQRHMDRLAKIAFPVGSRHLCTNWRFPVYVTIQDVHSEDNIRVLSDTGREYHTSSWCLGAKRD